MTSNTITNIEYKMCLCPGLLQASNMKGFETIVELLLNTPLNTIAVLTHLTTSVTVNDFLSLFVVTIRCERCHFVVGCF